MMNLSIKFIIFVFIMMCSNIYGQNKKDTILIKSFCDSTLKAGDILHIEPKEKNQYPSCDSLGRKQGYWHLDVDEEIAIYDEKSSEIFSGSESGFYVDNKKEGIWEVYNKNFSLVSHRIYQNDTIIYEIFYKNKKIKAIIKTKMNRRLNNFNTYGTLYRQEIFYFDKKGRIRYLRYKTPDNEIEETYY